MLIDVVDGTITIWRDSYKTLKFAEISRGFWKQATARCYTNDALCRSCEMEGRRFGVWMKEDTSIQVGPEAKKLQKTSSSSLYMTATYVWCSVCRCVLVRVWLDGKNRYFADGLHPTLMATIAHTEAM